MEARLIRPALLVGILFSLGAHYRTENFIVEAASSQVAERVGLDAEKFRRDLAVHWLGEALPTWSQPCPIKVDVGANLGAGGATSFLFDRGQVYGWRMNIQGSLERVLDSVLPHEVTHTIFASHFRQPLPRWADEGACTTVEHRSEKLKQHHMLIQFLRSGRGIAFSQMFMMKEYPQDVMPLYSQGYSLVTFLIQKGGHRKFINYLADGMQDEQWTETTREHYGFTNLADLQDAWLDWVRKGSPPPPKGNILASTTGGASVTPVSARQPRPQPNLIYRGQSADPPTGDRMVPLQRPGQSSGTAGTILDAVAPGPADETDQGTIPGWQSMSSRNLSSSASTRGLAATSSRKSRQVVLEWDRAPVGAAVPAGSSALRHPSPMALEPVEGRLLR